jgi:hypothetical protein
MLYLSLTYFFPMFSLSNVINSFPLCPHLLTELIVCRKVFQIIIVTIFAPSGGAGVKDAKVYGLCNNLIIRLHILKMLLSKMSSGNN